MELKQGIDYLVNGKIIMPAKFWSDKLGLYLNGKHYMRVKDSWVECEPTIIRRK